VSAATSLTWLRTKSDLFYKYYTKICSIIAAAIFSFGAAPGTPCTKGENAIELKFNFFALYKQAYIIFFQYGVIISKI